MTPRGSAPSSTATLPRTKGRATRSSAAASRQASPVNALLPEEGDLTPAASNTCYNCGVDSTPLWRRDGGGNVICNACGLYFKLHGIVRPISMKRAVIKRRRRRATNLTAKTLPLPLVVGRSSSMPLSASSADTSTSQHALPSDEGSDYSPMCSPVSHQQSAQLHRQPPVCFPGIESLMRAAEFISLPDHHASAADDALLAQVSRSLDRKRPYSEASSPSPSALLVMQENLLHSLATVATAEISLSKKRCAIASTPGSAIGGQSVPFSYHDEHNFQHIGYREELERECQRLANMEYSGSHAQ
ncbi:GATA type transcriptional activator of nitrogen-regulated proteins [Coemansia sp. BCRC 34962]|nr:GATA type transcriptional activator of nitrogen-regulated proteins [Coemansia sp. BCRC 34962]